MKGEPTSRGERAVLTALSGADVPHHTFHGGGVLPRIPRYSHPLFRPQRRRTVRETTERQGRAED